MQKHEIKNRAIEIVGDMLLGRCAPEVDDVEHVTDDASEQQEIINEIDRILTRLCKSLKA